MKTIVVGAGGGGISSAILARKRGHEVCLIEAHENLGGCASWFKRGSFIFDAGATTLSGLKSQQPLGKLFSLMGKKPSVYPQDPGIVFHLSSGKKISYYQDFEKWMFELEKAFPSLNHRPFWKKVYKINDEAWGLLSKLSNFPFQKPEDFLGVFKLIPHTHLLPYLFISTDLMLKRYGLEHPEYLELINGILLISAQAHADQLPFLIGALGLAYPQDTYVPVGGMKGLMDFFESSCTESGIKIIKKTKISNISKHKLSSTSGEEFYGDEIILNVDHWNLPNLFEGPDKIRINQKLDEKKEAWGAFTLYFGCRSQISELYQQIHLNHPDVKNYFISFSHPEDIRRAPAGFQAVTISTHTQARDWFEMDKETYQANKKRIQNLILKDCLERFQLEDIKFLTAGTPRSFERFTHRRYGFVGGLPFLFGMNPWKLEGHMTPWKHIHKIGDTTFPGQGLVGVVAGALSLDAELKKEL